jgi:hypothetical protein
MALAAMINDFPIFDRPFHDSALNEVGHLVVLV